MNIIKQISDYFLGEGGTILDEIIVGVILIVIGGSLALFWKNIFKFMKLIFKLLNYLRKRVVVFFNKKYRKLKGYLTYDEFIVIADKKEKEGIKLTKRENMLYEKNAPKYPYRKLLKGMGLNIDKEKLDEFLKISTPLNIKLVEPPKFDNIIFKK